MPCGELCAAVVVKGCPGGADLSPLWGTSAVRCCPSPRRPSLGAGSRAPLPWFPGRGLCGRGVFSTGPPACAIASRRCVLQGWREGVTGRGALRRCEGRLRSGTRPPPAPRPQGEQLGSAAHVLRARVCGRGSPALTLWRARPAVGCAPRGWLEAVLGS